MFTLISPSPLLPSSPLPFSPFLSLPLSLMSCTENNIKDQRNF
jgi:hypothetical protein